LNFAQNNHLCNLNLNVTANLHLVLEKQQRS
jgi:hypothetical protein